MGTSSRWLGVVLAVVGPVAVALVLVPWRGGSADAAFKPGSAPPELPTLGHGNLVVRSGHGADGALATVAVPVEHVGHAHGHLVVRLPTPGSLLAVPPDRRAQCTAVADLLGAAIARAPRPSLN